jgi:16S rRNA G1207 methylase RsmC
VSAPSANREIRFSARLRGRDLTFVTTWGLFSPRGIDDGSRLLIERCRVEPADRCLDLGCGYGAIGVALAAQCPRGSVDLVDKDFVAVEYARRNAEENGLGNCRAYLSNGLDAVPGDARFDLVAANLPGQVGNEMLSILVEDAHARLASGGRLWVVTVAGLRRWVERRFKEVFGNYEKVKQRGTHTVAAAVKGGGERG